MHSVPLMIYLTEFRIARLPNASHHHLETREKFMFMDMCSYICSWKGSKTHDSAESIAEDTRCANRRPYKYIYLSVLSSYSLVYTVINARVVIPIVKCVRMWTTSYGMYKRALCVTKHRNIKYIRRKLLTELKKNTKCRHHILRFQIRICCSLRALNKCY